LLDVLAGYEAGDPHWAPPPARPFVEECDADPPQLRIALALEPPIETPVDPACSAAARDAAELLESLGHRVEEALPPWRHDDLFPLFMTIWNVFPAIYPVRDLDLLEPLARDFTLRAQATTGPETILALMRLHAIGRGIVAFALEYDAILTPTLALPPVPVGWVFEPDDTTEQVRRAAAFTPFTQIANITGLPAVSLPLHWSEDGLPIGAQLIGHPADEATLIRVSAQLERARPWRDRRPPVSDLTRPG
jgi:amidase